MFCAYRVQPLDLILMSLYGRLPELHSTTLHERQKWRKKWFSSKSELSFTSPGALLTTKPQRFVCCFHVAMPGPCRHAASIPSNWLAPSSPNKNHAMGSSSPLLWPRRLLERVLHERAHTGLCPSSYQLRERAIELPRRRTTTTTSFAATCSRLRRATSTTNRGGVFLRWALDAERPYC